MAGYTVNITEVRDVVTATSSVNNITITSDNNPEITVVENSFLFTATSVVNTVTVYTDAVELLIDDFANYFRGDWISGTTYRRGELVNDRYSLFVCSTGTLTTVTSTINPSDYPNTLSWTRVVWNEGPRAHLTVTNYLNVGTTATISGNTNIGGRLHVVGEISTDSAMDHLTVTNHLSAGSLSVGSVDGEGLTINSSATFNGRSTFNNDVIINAGTTTVTNLVVLGTQTVSGALRVNNSGTFQLVNTQELEVLNTATFTEVVTSRLRVANVLYPTVTGLFGQVVANMGDGTAEWRNLGDLVFWSLSDDLKTNGFDIVTNSLTEDLLVGVGIGANKKSSAYLELKYNGATTLTSGNGEIALSGNTDIGGNTDIDGNLTVGTINSGAIDSSGNFRLTGTGYNNITSSGILTIGANNKITVGTVSQAGYGTDIFGTDAIRIWNNGAISSGTIHIGLQSGTPSALPQMVMSTTGTLMTHVRELQFEDGSVQYTANTATLSTTATSSVLGAVKIGNYIDITADGTISVNTASLASVTLNTATSTLLGGVKIGSSFTADGDGTLGLSTATSARLGGVKLGEYLQSSSDGTLTVNTSTLFANYTSVNTATTARAGIVRVGNNINIDGDARISVPVSQESTWGVVRIKTNGGLQSETIGGSAGFIGMKPATRYNIGGVIAGNNINIDESGVISVSGGGTAGIINLTDVMNTNGYKIQYNYIHTTSSLELLPGDFNISAPNNFDLSTDNTNVKSLDGQVTISSKFGNIASSSTFNVYKDYTTGQSPKYDFVARGWRSPASNAYNDFNVTADDNVTISASKNVNIRSTETTTISAPTVNIEGNTVNISGTSVNIESNNLGFVSTGTLTLNAPVVKIGPDNNNSELHVQKIYNYAGTYAPFFPAGIQLADQTVQVTAYHPDGGPLPAV
jgi:hypothetical protein